MYFLIHKIDASSFAEFEYPSSRYREMTEFENSRFDFMFMCKLWSTSQSRVLFWGKCWQIVKQLDPDSNYLYLSHWSQLVRWWLHCYASTLRAESYSLLILNAAFNFVVICLVTITIICDVVLEKVPYGRTNSAVINKQFAHVVIPLYLCFTMHKKRQKCSLYICSWATHIVGPDQTPRACGYKVNVMRKIFIIVSDCQPFTLHPLTATHVQYWF